MPETTYPPKGVSLTAPGLFDAGCGVSYTPYYADEARSQLAGLFLWHPCPVRWDQPGIPAVVPGTGPNARTDGAWGYENTADPAHITLHGSVLDPECGWHGFIRDGRWVPC